MLRDCRLRHLVIFSASWIGFNFAACQHISPGLINMSLQCKKPVLCILVRLGFFFCCWFFFVLLAAAHVSVPLIWHLSTYTFSRIPPRCQTHLAALHAGQICDLILHYPPRSLLSLTQATLLSSLSSHLLSWHSADTCRLAASARWYWPNPEPVQIQPVRRHSWSPLA